MPYETNTTSTTGTPDAARPAHATTRSPIGVHRSGRATGHGTEHPQEQTRHGNDRRYRSAAYGVARKALGRQFHREAVADVVDVVTGYGRGPGGLRDDDGRYRGIVVIAVRAVAGGCCDEATALRVLDALEPMVAPL